MPTRRARLRRKIYRHLPLWLRNHDFEVLAGVLGMAGGIPLVTGQVEPRSINDLLPHVVVFIWGLVLVLGCSSMLLGIIMASRTVYPARIIWMRIEALGLTALAYFSYLYTVCIIGVNLQTGWLVGMIVLVFGGVCHVREVAIHMDLEAYRLSLGLEEKV